MRKCLVFVVFSLASNYFYATLKNRIINAKRHEFSKKEDG